MNVDVSRYTSQSRGVEAHLETSLGRDESETFCDLETCRIAELDLRMPDGADKMQVARESPISRRRLPVE